MIIITAIHGGETCPFFMKLWADDQFVLNFKKSALVRKHGFQGKNKRQDFNKT
jgi:hypothetical protein